MVATCFLLFTVQFIHVAFKAYQQLNVVHHSTRSVLPLSFAMAAAEICVISQVAVTYMTHDWQHAVLLVFPVGLGGGLGCLFSMWLHKRWRS